VHAGVIRGNDDQAGFDAGDCYVEEGIGRYVQSDMLHRRQRPSAIVGRPDGHINSYFLIRRPFGVHTRICGQILQDFRAWSAGIGRGYRRSSLPRAARNCFIARQNRFHLDLH